VQVEAGVGRQRPLQPIGVHELQLRSWRQLGEAAEQPQQQRVGRAVIHRLGDTEDRPCVLHIGDRDVVESVPSAVAGGDQPRHGPYIGGQAAKAPPRLLSARNSNLLTLVEVIEQQLHGVFTGRAAGQAADQIQLGFAKALDHAVGVEHLVDEQPGVREQICALQDLLTVVDRAGPQIAVAQPGARKVQTLLIHWLQDSVAG